MMDLKQKLYKMFILGLEGGGYVEALKNGLGGLIFFTKDIQSQEQFKALIEECKAIATSKIFLSIDQEGGRVERTENIHHGKKYLSAKFAYEKGEDFLRRQTEEIAQELKSYGINLNFAPCIDVNTNPQNPIIGERSFSNNPDEVALAGKITAQIFRKNGIIPCAKHFPGHGDANADSHLTLPKIDLDFENLKQNHIKPFKSLVDDEIEMIMAAHLYIPYLSDGENIPTSLSKKALNYLRQDLGFKGVIISDDMVMKGVSGFGPVKACEMGIKAGIDMFIYRNSTPETVEIIEKLYEIALQDSEMAEKIEQSYKRISILCFNH
ncbi:glycoside hydrolase family 3 protein [bacterium]|nr:glycoside hydrolase family 3 protein [bacterium]